MGLKKLKKKMKFGFGAEKPRCFICGCSENLIKTECCDKWICDDESEYVMFSFDRNSCSRNHRRYTLCGHHHNEEHPGHWQDCPKCKEDFKKQMEMYVHFGTNEYNHETLKEIPSFEPTYCIKCNKRIHLAEDGYYYGPEGHICENCSDYKLPSPEGDDFSMPEIKTSDLLELIKSKIDEEYGDYDDDEDDYDDDYNDNRPLRLSVPHIEYIPKKAQARFDIMDNLLEEFAVKFRTIELFYLSLDLLVSLCVQFPDEICKGKPSAWAAGMYHALGFVNFLSDKSFEPYVPVSEISKFYGVSKSTMLARSGYIRDTFEMFQADPIWTVPSLLVDNPLSWTYEIDDVLVDVSTLPEKEQKKLVKKGIIPMTHPEFKKSVEKNLKQITSDWDEMFTTTAPKPEITEKPQGNVIKLDNFRSSKK